MKNRSVLCTALLAVGLVLPAHAGIIRYDVTLTGAQESPSNLSAATGQALLTLDDVANTLDLTLFWTGLTTGNTAGHIHFASTFGTNGGVIIGFAGMPTGLTSGSWSNTFTGLSATTVGRVSSGTAYVNLHNSAFPGGEIRGNITADTIVPEPATLALAGSCLAALAVWRRRKA